MTKRAPLLTATPHNGLFPALPNLASRRTRQTKYLPQILTEANKDRENSQPTTRLVVSATHSPASEL